MTAVLQKLIESLRNELEQYGEMLALLEQQQEAAGLGTEDVMHSIAAINAQGATIQTARQQRQQRDFARALWPRREQSARVSEPALAVVREGSPTVVQ